MTDTPTQPQGWYDNPDNPADQFRWWTGTEWSDQIRPKNRYPSFPRSRPLHPLPGQPPRRLEGGSWSGWLLLVVAVFGAYLAFGTLFGWFDTGPWNEGSTDGAYVRCQRYLEARLEAPSTAAYPAPSSDFTTSLDGQRYRVDAWFDAANSAGALTRTRFSCTVRYAGRDTWQLEDLETFG